jgi:hypothetical protein
MAERLFQILNQQHDEYNHEQSLLNNLFMHFCVYGTPTLRKEAARFLMQQLGSQISFPAKTLRTFFSSNPEWSRPLNMFPQQEVFDTLQVQSIILLNWTCILFFLKLCHIY